MMMFMKFDWLTPEIILLLWHGFWLTIWLTAITSILALVMGILVGTLKISPRPLLKRLASFYIEVNRNVPALVLIVFWAFAIPNIFPAHLRSWIFFANPAIESFGDWSGLSVPYYSIAAGIALTLNASAYLAQIFRAGVGTIPRQYFDAARTLGASRWAILWRIMIPQGLRAAFPAISTRLIHNMKNTALAAVVSTPEFFYSIQTGITRSFRAVELLTLASGVYLLISFGLSSLLGRVEAWLNRSARPAKI
jgi:polar amino acid transport system permease protein